MLQAWPERSTERFFIDTDGSGSSTFSNRDRFKQAGARWDGKRWSVTDEQRIELGIEKMIQVEVQGCCVGIEEEYVPESQAIVGTHVSFFCGRCDSRKTTQVVRVQGVGTI